MNEVQINNYPVPLVHTPELISLSGAKLRFRPDILKAEGLVLELPTGVSVLAGIKIAMRESGHKISLRGAKIYFSEDFPSDILKPLPRDEWTTTIIGPKSLVNLIYPVYGGGGGKNPFATILSIVVMVGVAMTSFGVGEWALGAGFSAAMSAGIGALAGAVVGLAGSLIINAIAPPSKAKLTQANTNADSVWSIDGMRNRTALYESIPLILGKVRFAPRYGANPYTFLKGNNQFARYLFVTMGRNKVENVRIGDTNISRFKDVRYKVWENWQGEALSFFPASVYEEALNITLNESGSQFRTTTQDTEEAQLEFYLPKGLGEINRSGELNSHTVSVNIAYRAVGTSTWKAWFVDQAVSGGSLQIDVGAAPTHTPASERDDRGRTVYLPGATDYSRKGRITIYANSSGGIGFSGSYVLAAGSWEAKWKWENIGTWPSSNMAWVYKGTTITISKKSEFSGSVTSSGTSIIVGSGAYQEFSRNITKSTVTPQRFGFTKDLTVGQYEIRVSSASAKYDYNPENQVFNEIYWNIIRSVRTGPVLRYQGVPMTVIELEIKATEQLNGNVDEFNAEFTSYAPVWDEQAEEWADAPSNNIASLGMLLATSPVIHREPGDPWASIDIDAWARFYVWCKKNGWKYNSVQTSEECAGEVLYNILAAGRAAFSFKNGSKLSVTWDSTDKPVSYVFGPRNSWGFASQKTFKKDPTHALRCLFLNEQKDYQEDERIVYNDGYVAGNATNIIQKDFDGVTSPDLIYRLARLTMADEIWRPETYTLSTDYAFLNVAKGDLVRVAHYVPMWGITQARVAGLVYDEEDQDKVVAVRIDEHVTMEAGKEYAFNWYPSGSECHSYSVETEEGTTTVLKLPMPIPLSQAPDFMGLVNFGAADRIDHDCIVTSIEPGDNFTAAITLQDYSADEIFNAMTGPIPPWDSDITIPSRWQLGKPGTPQITIVNTDEHVLRRSDDGSFIPRIQVGFIVPEKEGVSVAEIRVQVRPTSSSGGDQEEWIEAGRTNAGTGFVYAEGVQERVEYDVRIAAVSSTGVVSEFSTVYTATVIGRTTPPPAPINLRLEGNKLAWQMPENAPMDVRGWEVWIGMDADDPFSYAKKISNPYTPVMEFDISAWAGWARRVWVRTIDDIGLTSVPVYYIINLGDMPVQNVVYEILESERGWPGTVQKGTRVAGTGLLSFAGRTTWGDSTMWGNSPMWGGDVLQMVYTSYMGVPADAITSKMKIIPILAAGAISSIEWEISESYQMWGDSSMWGELPFMGIQSSNDWLPLSNETLIDEEVIIGVRITFSTAFPAIVPDVRWVFDVEDEEEKYNGILVETTGTRIPVEARRFRWIKGVTFGLAQTEEEANAVRVIRGKGTEILEGGYVISGPMIYCFDENNNPVEGRVDALVQGAKGDSNYG